MISIVMLHSALDVIEPDENILADGWKLEIHLKTVSVIALQLQKVDAHFEHGRALGIMPQGHNLLVFELLFASLKQANNISLVLLNKSQVKSSQLVLLCCLLRIFLIALNLPERNLKTRHRCQFVQCLACDFWNFHEFPIELEMLTHDECS